METTGSADALRDEIGRKMRQRERESETGRKMRKEREGGGVG